jgi:hypothetical protein
MFQTVNNYNFLSFHFVNKLSTYILTVFVIHNVAFTHARTHIHTSTRARVHTHILSLFTYVNAISHSICRGILRIHHHTASDTSNSTFLVSVTHRCHVVTTTHSLTHSHSHSHTHTHTHTHTQVRTGTGQKISMAHLCCNRNESRHFPRHNKHQFVTRLLQHFHCFIVIHGNHRMAIHWQHFVTYLKKIQFHI